MCAILQRLKEVPLQLFRIYVSISYEIIFKLYQNTLTNKTKNTLTNKTKNTNIIKTTSTTSAQRRTTKKTLTKQPTTIRTIRRRT